MDNLILHKILNVSNKELDSLDTKFIDKYFFYHEPTYFHLKSGKEHYRLLMFISMLYKNEILFDIGTHRCLSAAALSYSMRNRIKSYDIIKKLFVNPLLPKVTYFLGDTTKDNELIKSKFIFLDTEHDGIFENIFYNHLKKINWKGLLLLDDIVDFNNEMRTFWNNITEEKYDLTSKGHWSGTGIAYFK